MRKKLKKLKDKWLENMGDAIEMIGDFQDAHPFLFGHFYGCFLIYWVLVIWGWFHPGKVLGWVDKK